MSQEPTNTGKGTDGNGEGNEAGGEDKKDDNQKKRAATPKENWKSDLGSVWEPFFR